MPFIFVYRDDPIRYYVDLDPYPYCTVKRVTDEEWAFIDRALTTAAQLQVLLRDIDSRPDIEADI